MMPLTTNNETESAETLRALVVDDSRAARMMVGNMMKQLGFEVVTADHGQDALDKLNPEAPPDAVVADWNMPVMDGVEFARALRKLEDYRGVPILMISSESDPRRVASALLAGVDEYLFKPVDTHMLHERLTLMGVTGMSFA